MRIILKPGIIAYHDTIFNGLIRCRVLSVSGNSESPRSSIEVKFRYLENRGAYKKGEIDIASSIFVCPAKAIHRRAYSTTIRQYSVQS